MVLVPTSFAIRRLRCPSSAPASSFEDDVGGITFRFFHFQTTTTGRFVNQPRSVRKVAPLLLKKRWPPPYGRSARAWGGKFSSVGRVLLLNATYEPLQLVSERRAVVLVLAGRAEPVVTPEHPSVCRSATIVVPIPSIVRLHSMVRLPTKMRTPPLTRRSILLRDDYRCAYCEEHADTIDHVVPRSRGGRHEWTNVVASCRRHNMLKSDRLLDELGCRIRIQPRGPEGPWWRWRHVLDPDPLWEPYLPKAS